jgi:hypothetical protein
MGMKQANNKDSLENPEYLVFWDQERKGKTSHD